MGGRLHLIGVLAHFPIYAAVGWGILPYPQPTAAVLVGAASIVGAWFWPYVDYVLVATLATVCTAAAALVTAAAIAAAYLAARVVEAME